MSNAAQPSGQSARGHSNEPDSSSNVVVLVEGLAMNWLASKLLGPIAAVGCLILAGLLLVQTGRLHTAEKAASKAMLELSNEHAAWADERANAATALAVATTKERETEQQLTAQADTIKEETNAQITALSSRAAALASRLRNAQANAATERLVSKTTADARAPEVARVCDGGELSGKFGEQLVSEAARADTIRLQLASCEKQYDAARDALRR